MVPDNSNSPTKSTWRLQMFGGFRLLDPDGVEIRLKDRKIEALLVVLVLHREYGIERSAAAEILWPNRFPDNLPNLRQALSRLRSSIGEDSIEANRANLRLAPSFTVETDWQDFSRQGGFMPGHESLWFDEIRLETEADQESGGTRDSAVYHFYQTLQWFAANDRKGLHALLCARPSMARGLNYANLLELLKLSPEDQDCHGWSQYWQGAAEDNLEKCAELLRNAVRHAKGNDDMVLASEACLELGKVYGRTGKVDRAMKICDIADSIARNSTSRTAKANALRLRGTIMVHWQDAKQGLALLKRAEQYIDDPVDLVVAKSSRAYFEASSQDYDSAARTIQASASLARELGHYRIGIVSTFTNVLLKAAGGSRNEAIEELIPLRKSFYDGGTTQFGVYADELLARLLFLQGEDEMGDKYLKSAQLARQSSQMITTELEARRVSQFE